MFEVALAAAPFILGTLTLVFVNGLFVAAEFAIVRVRRTRLEELAGEGKKAAERAILLVDHISEYLAVTQIGVTAASLGVGWLGEGAFARLLALLLPGTRVPSLALQVAAVLAAFLFMTAVQVVLGELVPKNLAIRKAEPLLLGLSRPLQVLHFVLRPAIRLFDNLASLILHLMGHGATPPTPITEEELKLVLRDSHDEGIVTRGEANIIVRAFEFADKQAKDIMIPAERVDYVSLSRSVHENLDVAKRHVHARLPLCQAGLDSVVGIVSMKDVWPLLERERSNAAFERACRRQIRLPSDLPQDGILKLLQEGHCQMGIVRDRADTKTLGVVTLEDVLESLVGDVRETPPQAAPPRSQL
jgi:CBS domain containing-hemolysin-like protein